MKYPLSVGILAVAAACSQSQEKSRESTARGEQTPSTSAGAGSGSYPAPAYQGNETTADKALSVVDLGEFKGPMSLPLTYVFRERHPASPPDSPISTLEYSVGKLGPSGAVVGLIVRLAFNGEPATVRLGQDGYIGIWEPGLNGEQWDSVGGTATIRPDASGTRARVDVAMEFVGVATKQRRTLTGFLEGQIWQSCYVLETRTQSGILVNGMASTITDYAIDEDWSSPFCASVKPK
jgi:hypothetical protein